MNPCMYLILPSPATTPMSPGKLAAQAAHAAVEAWLASDPNKQVVNRWHCGGHYTKVVLMANDLFVAERYLQDRGFTTVMIIDEGRTEFGGGLTPTALGVAIVDKDELHVKETFSAFELYKERQETDDELAARIEKLHQVNHYSLSPKLKAALSLYANGSSHLLSEEEKKALVSQGFVNIGTPGKNIIRCWGRGKPPWRSKGNGHGS